MGLGGWFGGRFGGIATAVLIIAAALVLFEPALTAVYLHHDDWVHRIAEPFRYRSSPSFLHLVLMGRPVCSLCTFAAFSLFTTIEGAWMARLAVVLVLAAVAIATARFLEREGIDRWVASAWAFAMLALPGGLVIGYWLGVSCLATGWLLAALAGLATQRSLRGDNGLRWSILGAALLAAAFAAHQQIAAIYLALLAAAIARAEVATLWPMLRRYMAIGAAGAGTYLAGYLTFAWLIFPDTYARFRALDPERTTFLADLSGGLLWLARSLGPRASALWFDDLVLPTAPAVGVVVLIMALVGILARSRARYGLRVAVVLGAIVLAGAPAMLTGYRLETYRLALPSSAVIVAVFAASHDRRWLDRLSAIAMAALVGYYAQPRLAAIVAPAAQETLALQDAIADAGELRDAAVEIVVPPQRLHIGTDEFGILSTRFPFNARAAATVIRRELGLAPVEVTVSENDPAAAPDRRLIIDFRPLAEEFAFPSLWPR